MNKLKEAYKRLTNNDIKFIEYVYKGFRIIDKKFSLILREHLVYSILLIRENNMFLENLIGFILENKLMTKEKVIEIANDSGKKKL